MMFAQAALHAALHLFLPRLIALAARINAPIEKRINDGFIRDAVRILRAHDHLRIIGVTSALRSSLFMVVMLSLPDNKSLCTV